MESINLGRKGYDISEKLLKEFEILYPNLKKEIRMWGGDGPNRIYIRLKDGRSLTFDAFQKVTFLKNESNIGNVAEPDMTKEEFITHVSTNLKKIMQKYNVTQKELSKYAGTTERNLSIYCSGSRIPNLYVCYKIARALKISLNELLGL